MCTLEHSQPNQPKIAAYEKTGPLSCVVHFYDHTRWVVTVEPTEHGNMIVADIAPLEIYYSSIPLVRPNIKQRLSILAALNRSGALTLNPTVEVIDYIRILLGRSRIMLSDETKWNIFIDVHPKHKDVIIKRVYSIVRYDYVSNYEGGDRPNDTQRKLIEDFLMVVL